MTLVAPLCQFPAEINNVIFSYLDLKQLLECSLVCRQWRDNIPAWIQTQDRSLCLSMKHLNNARPSLQYLGRVVQGINFAPREEKVNVQQVLGNLLALDLPDVDTLQLCFMPAEGSSVIEASKAWYQLGAKLRRLRLDFNEPAIAKVDISPLLDYCPFLTHLTITFPRSRDSYYLKYFVQGRHLQLQYLRFDARIELQDLLSLVRHCPELRYLCFDWDHSMDMKQILDVCPSLKGVAVNTRINHFIDRWWKDRRRVPMATRSSTTASLQELDLRLESEDLYLQTATMLTQHCEHLKRLSLDINIGDWEGPMKQHDLRTLVYDPLPALKDFTYCSYYRKTPGKAWFAIPLLKKCQNLKYISINTEDAGSICRALVGFHLPYLRCLRVNEWGHEMGGLEDLLFSIANTKSPLERLKFTGDVFRSDRIYQALAQISSLRHIQLHDSATSGPRDKKIMTQCLSRLRGDGVTSTPATRNLESIIFMGVEGFMTVDAFGSLRKILPLKRVTFYRCGPMSERGLRLLVDRQPPLEYLEIRLGSGTTDGNSLEPLLAYARTRIPIVKTPSRLC